MKFRKFSRSFLRYRYLKCSKVPSDSLGVNKNIFSGNLPRGSIDERRKSSVWDRRKSSVWNKKDSAFRRQSQFVHSDDNISERLSKSFE